MTHCYFGGVCHLHLQGGRFINIVGPEGRKVAGGGGNYIQRSVIISILHRVLLIIRAIIMRTRWAGYVERKGRTINVYVILVGTYEWKRLLERSSRRWKDNF
jgi:hypothetical protein